MPQGTGPYHKRNLLWPLQRRGAGFRQGTLVQRYETALLHLARTPRSAYYSDPEYGASLYRLRTQGVNDALLEAVLEDLRRSVATYIPDIMVQNVQAMMDDTIQKLVVTLTWSVRGATAQLHGDLARTQTVTLTI